MRKVMLTLAIWLLSVLIVLTTTEITRFHTTNSVVGLTILSFVLLVVLTVALYYPALRFLDRKFGKRYFLQYPLITGVVLNVPVFLLLGIATLFFISFGEGILLIILHAIASSFFGWAYRLDI